MIGTLSDWRAYAGGGHDKFETALDALAQLAAESPSPGRIDIDGDRLYATVMQLEGKSTADQLAEKHERYIDVHVVLEGKELIGWSPLPEGLVPAKPYEADADYLLAEPAADETLLRLVPGMFAVFFPHDLHRPGLGEGEIIKKMVMKIHV